MRHQPRWNHNLHFHPLVLRAVPPGAASALDAGTGDGLLARDLARVLPDVTGIDADAAVLERAAATPSGIRWVHGDLMTHDFDRRFDLVGSIAVLHHLPSADEALRRLSTLVEPGGVLVVVGLARSSTPADVLLDLLGAVQHRTLLLLRRRWWEHSAPVVWPPPHTYRQVRAAARRLLPGATWRRHALWRYSIVWRRPA